jgi:hypothetical protein
LKKAPRRPWLHDLLKPHVTRVLVYAPHENALLKVGNKNDRIDARKLAELLYLNKLSSVHHGKPGIRTLKELARSCIAMTIPCAGDQVYAPRLLTGSLVVRRADYPTFFFACFDLGPSLSRRPGNRRSASSRQNVLLCALYFVVR